MKKAKPILTPAQKNLVEHIEAGNRTFEPPCVPTYEDIDHRGDSFHDYPTYIKHWESAKPGGWEIRILTENGLHIHNLRWNKYTRPNALKSENKK